MVGFDNVKDVIENYISSVYEKDVERFLTVYAPNIHIFDCWDNWEINGIVQWRSMVTGWFSGLTAEGELLKVEFHNIEIHENSNIAFVHCNVTFPAHNENSGLKLRQTTNRFTFCLKKERDSWAIFHEHSSIPVKIDTGKGIFNLK